MFRARDREVPLKGDHRSEDWGGSEDKYNIKGVS